MFGPDFKPSPGTLLEYFPPVMERTGVVMRGKGLRFQDDNESLHSPFFFKKRSSNRLQTSLDKNPVIEL